MYTKVCSKCGEEKLLTEFYERKFAEKNSYHYSYCKKCMKESMIKYSKSEKAIEKRKERQQKEEYKIYQKKWYTLKSKEYLKEYRKTEKFKDYQNKFQTEYKKTENCKQSNRKYLRSENARKCRIRCALKKEIGSTPPEDLVELKKLTIDVNKFIKQNQNHE